jgi:hypothetical protein
VLGSLACLILVPGAYSIEVGFSAGKGGESIGLLSSYDVDTGVSVSEESTASFDHLEIENTRSVSGKGNINAVQSYSGSGGYTGRATLSAQGASGILQGNALITPQCVAVDQDLSFTGDSIDIGMSIANKGDSANLGVAILSGMIDSELTTGTASVYNVCNGVINAPWSRIWQQTSSGGYIESTTSALENSNMKPIVFNIMRTPITAQPLASRIVET